MSFSEHTVWAMMAGGLLSLALVAAADSLLTRTLGAVRNLMIITIIGSACVLMSGLPETLFPGLPRRLVVFLEVGLGPLGSALGLRFLGIWTGSDREDKVVQRITDWGSFSMLTAGLVLMVLSASVPDTGLPGLLLGMAAVNSTAAALALVVAVRTALMGDPLGRWLVLACLILAGMVTGLHLKLLDAEGFGLGTWALTAISAELFLLIVMVLIIIRNRISRRLAKLARLETGTDPVTGLPTGSKLLFEVEHMFWRAARLRSRCIVVCVYLHNLYELGDTRRHTFEHQISAATAARIRRAAGFRCVVGLYHPRCFIIVFSTDTKRELNEKALISRFSSFVTQPLPVFDSRVQRQAFVPQVGISVQSVLPDRANPREVIDQAELLALEQVRQATEPSRRDPADAEDAVDTIW